MPSALDEEEAHVQLSHSFGPSRSTFGHDFESAKQRYLETTVTSQKGRKEHQNETTSVNQCTRT